jgi:hypothetical protein
MDLVEEGNISQAALHVCAEACRLKKRSELTNDERASVDMAVDLLMAVSRSTEARVPLPTYDIPDLQTA